MIVQCFASRNANNCNVRFYLRKLQHDNGNVNTAKPVLRGHSKIDKTKILMTNGSLMKVKSIAEWSILQYF